jgi:hypothetical protein
MKKIPEPKYPTTEEIDALIAQRESGLALLSSGEVKQKALAEVARLKSYAEMKRLLA